MISLSFHLGAATSPQSSCQFRIAPDIAVQIGSAADLELLTQALRETNGSEGKPRAPFGAGGSAKAPPGDDAEVIGAETVDFKIDDVD